MTGWIDALIQGVLLGGLYALFAAGLSLIFGVMRLVNLAHGDLIVLAAFVILVVAERLGLDPFAALVVANFQPGAAAGMRLAPADASSAALPFRHSDIPAALRSDRRDLHPLASDPQTDRALDCVRPRLKAAEISGQAELLVGAERLELPASGGSLVYQSIT